MAEQLSAAVSMDSVGEDTGCPHDVIGEKAHESFRPVRAQGETQDGLLARASGELLKQLGSRCSKAVESSAGEQTSTPASDFADSADVEFTLRKEELLRLWRGLKDWQTPADQAVSIEFRLHSQILEMVSQQRGLLLQMGERLQQATSQLDLSQQLGTKQQEQANDHVQTTERISEHTANLERRLEKTQRQLEPLTGARLHASRSPARSKPLTLEEVDRMMPGDPQRSPTSPRLQRGGSSSDNAAASADTATASKPATLGGSCIGPCAQDPVGVATAPGGAPSAAFPTSASDASTPVRTQSRDLVRTPSPVPAPKRIHKAKERQLADANKEIVALQRQLAREVAASAESAASRKEAEQKLASYQADHSDIAARYAVLEKGAEQRVLIAKNAMDVQSALLAKVSAELKDAKQKLRNAEEVRSARGSSQGTMHTPEIGPMHAVIGKSSAADLGEVDSTAKATARKRLQGAWQAGGLPALDAAIEEGERLGLRDCELEVARKKQASEVKMQTARQRLANAMQAKSADMLKAAIQHASGLPKGEVHAARQLLNELDRQREARSRLSNAVTSRGIGKLRTAIADGEAAGFNDEDLENARGLLKEEEHKADARRRLRQAVGTRDLHALRAAIANGDAVGLPEGDIKAAQRMIADLEQERRQKLKENIRMSRDVLRAAVEMREINPFPWVVGEDEELKMKVVNSLAEADKKRDEKEAHGSEKLKMKIVNSLAEADKKKDEKEVHGSETLEMKVVSSLAEADKKSEEKEVHGGEEARGRRGAEDGEEEEACGSEEASGRARAKDGEEEKAPAAKSSVRDHDDDDTEYDRVNHLNFGCFSEVR